MLPVCSQANIAIGAYHKHCSALRAEKFSLGEFEPSDLIR
jgi:hypothetical protein